MSAVKYRNSSQYSSTPQSSWFLANYEDRNISYDGTDQYITLGTKYYLRPDLLSWDLYSNTDFWWVFTILNPDVIIDPIYDMIPGIQIYVPTRQRLSTLLGA
jgi:hypothetical protein